MKIRWVKARKKDKNLSPEEIPTHFYVLKGKFQRMLGGITPILRLQMKNNEKYARLHGEKNIKSPRRVLLRPLAMNSNS